MDKNFGVEDFTVFIVLLGIPSGIGLYYGYRDRQKRTTSNYYFGEKKLHPVAVGISLAATSISAISMIGYPAEVYIIGTVFAWAPVMLCVAALFAAVYYIPFYYRLDITTIFEYLELRFNRQARKICALMMTLSGIFNMGVMIYLPSLALSAVAPLPVSWGIAITSILCTIYTTLGGMKAVIWTDVVQASLMLFATFAVFIRGVASIGGLGELVNSLDRGDRLTFFSLDNIDISSRMSPFALTFGEVFIHTFIISFYQPNVQRFQSCGTIRRANLALIAYVIPAGLIVFQALGNGCLLYAYFEGCDPLKSGKLERLDQGIPYIASQVFKDMPGMTGLFVSSVFSGTLSTASSGLNSYSVVILEDVIVPIVPTMTESRKLVVGKILASVIGLLVMVLSYLISMMSSNVFKIAWSFSGLVTGPVLGMFLSGMFLPWTNALGAIVGTFSSFIFLLWILIGSNLNMTYQPNVTLPPVSIDNCSASMNLTSINDFNVTTMMPFATSVSTSSYEAEWPTFDQILYSINFHFYVLFGSFLVVIVATVVSFITGPNSPSEMDPKLFIPLFDNSVLPAKVRKFFRFGVPLGAKNENVDGARAVEMEKLNS